MKRMRKLASLLLAMVMVFAMTATAFAADTTYTITAPANGHTYEVYQIFTGDLSTKKVDNKDVEVLSNVKWGTNGTGETGTKVDATILAAIEAVAGKTTDSEKLAVIEEYVDLTSTPEATLTNEASKVVVAGYYLIKDKDNSVSGDDTYTTYIVEVVGDVTIDPKSEKPSSEKKVKDTNDSTGVTTDWQDSADHDISDKVSFQLKGIVAADYDEYDTYYFAFHDKEESGLTFNNDVKVYVDGTEITTGFEVVTSTSDGCTFEVVFEDLKDIGSVKAGSVITAEYTSTLNENAVLGSAGNPNKMHLEYSNNPNEEQDGDNKPETGETPDDTVIVFTYKTVINKVDSEGKALTGAEFKLEKKQADGTWEVISVVKNDEGTTFTFKGLDDGIYKLTETTTPAGYNTIDDIYFEVTATHNTLSDNPALTGLQAIQKKDANGADLDTGVVATFTATCTPDAGTIETNIVNQKGATLPETGGMGTTLIYIVGAVLMIGAAVLLITKKRMSNVR